MLLGCKVKKNLLKNEKTYSKMKKLTLKYGRVHHNQMCVYFSAEGHIKCRGFPHTQKSNTVHLRDFFYISVNPCLVIIERLF